MGRMGLDNVKAIIVLSPLDRVDRILLSLLDKMDKKKCDYRIEW